MSLEQFSGAAFNLFNAQSKPWMNINAQQVKAQTITTSGNISVGGIQCTGLTNSGDEKITGSSTMGSLTVNADIQCNGNEAVNGHLSIGSLTSGQQVWVNPSSSQLISAAPSYFNVTGNSQVLDGNSPSIIFGSPVLVGNNYGTFDNTTLTIGTTGYYYINFDMVLNMQTGMNLTQCDLFCYLAGYGSMFGQSVSPCMYGTTSAIGDVAMSATKIVKLTSGAQLSLNYFRIVTAGTNPSLQGSWSVILIDPVSE